MAPKPKYNAKQDACQTRLVKIWRDAHLLVEIDDKPHYDVKIFGYGGPRGGYWTLIEIKTKSGELTSTQQEFQEKWPGAVLVVYDDPDPVLRAYGVIS
jgi:hypothetical protein